MQDKWRKAIRFMTSASEAGGDSFRDGVLWRRGREWKILSRDFAIADSPLVRLVLVSNTLAAIGALCGILLLLRSRSPYAFPLAACVRLCFP